MNLAQKLTVVVALALAGVIVAVVICLIPAERRREGRIASGAARTEIQGLLAGAAPVVQKIGRHAFRPRDPAFEYATARDELTLRLMLPKTFAGRPATLVVKQDGQVVASLGKEAGTAVAATVKLPTPLVPSLIDIDVLVKVGDESVAVSGVHGIRVIRDPRVPTAVLIGSDFDHPAAVHALGSEAGARPIVVARGAALAWEISDERGIGQIVHEIQGHAPVTESYPESPRIVRKRVDLDRAATATTGTRDVGFTATNLVGATVTHNAQLRIVEPDSPELRPEDHEPPVVTFSLCSTGAVAAEVPLAPESRPLDISVDSALLVRMSDAGGLNPEQSGIDATGAEVEPIADVPDRKVLRQRVWRVSFPGGAARVVVRAVDLAGNRLNLAPLDFQVAAHDGRQVSTINGHLAPAGGSPVVLRERRLTWRVGLAAMPRRPVMVFVHARTGEPVDLHAEAPASGSPLTASGTIELGGEADSETLFEVIIDAGDSDPEALTCLYDRRGPTMRLAGGLVSPVRVAEGDRLSLDVSDLSGLDARSVEVSGAALEGIQEVEGGHVIFIRVTGAGPVGVRARDRLGNGSAMEFVVASAMPESASESAPASRR